MRQCSKESWQIYLRPAHGLDGGWLGIPYVTYNEPYQPYYEPPDPLYKPYIYMRCDHEIDAVLLYNKWQVIKFVQEWRALGWPCRAYPPIYLPETQERI